MAHENRLTSSTITATPTGGSSAPTLTVTGSASGGAIALVAPSTTGSIAVTVTDASGTSTPSAPLAFTTAAATQLPAAPAITYHWWAQANLVAASWTPGASGNSPIDSYQASFAPAGGDSTPPATILETVLPPTTSAYATVDNTFDWVIAVREHNAAGWSPWSAPVTLAAIGG